MAFLRSVAAGRRDKLRAVLERTSPPEAGKGPGSPYGTGEWRVFHIGVSGTPYEMGHEHGRALKLMIGSMSDYLALSALFQKT